MSTNHKRKTIDTHVHLYGTPQLKNLAWMKESENSPLNSSHTIDKYITDASDIDNLDIEGIIFIEVDVKSSVTTIPQEQGWELPIEEYAMIGRIISGKLDPNEGESNKKTRNLIKGFIPWAPIPLGKEAVDKYITLLKNKDKECYQFVKGFRYLVQDKPPKTMLQDKFIESLNWISENGFVFDLGIDVHNPNGGLWQFEEAFEMFSKTPNTTYIINHLTKPDLEANPKTIENYDKFIKWRELMTKLSKHEKSYMKFSGGFSELPIEIVNNLEKCIDYIYPWAKTCFELWGEDRFIWGSDWPVCTLKFEGSSKSINRWSTICGNLLGKFGVNEEGKNKIFYINAKKAYNL